MIHKSRIVNAEEKARICKNNGKSLARLTEEGWVCNLRGRHCPEQGCMSNNYTNFYFCIPKQRAYQNQINYINNQIKSINYQNYDRRQKN